MGALVRKEKTKLLLIDDYILLNKVSYLCDLVTGQDVMVEDIRNRNSRLLEIYEKLFFKFGIMDYSYLLLKRDLQNCKPKFFDQEVNMGLMNEQIKALDSSLAGKLKKLALNDVEIHYLIQKL